MLIECSLFTCALQKQVLYSVADSQHHYLLKVVELNVQVGKLLKKLRKERGVTLQRLGEVTGSNPTYLSKVENGRLPSTPNSKTLIAIADALEVDRDWLLTECGRPPEGMTASIAQHAEVFRRLGKMKGSQIESALQPYPLLGEVPAGPLAEAIEDAEEFDITECFAPGEHYLLRVKGNSMIEEGILNGDIAVVRPQTECEQGDLVIALVAGQEATLKRIYKQKLRIKLQPANSSMEPIFAKPDQVEIRGRVVGIIRTKMSL